jgi:hypothetical protein
MTAQDEDAVFLCHLCPFLTEDEQAYNRHMLEHQESEEDLYPEWDSWAELADEMRMEDR